MFKKNKIQFITKYLFPFVMCSLVAVYFVWNKPHKDYSDMKTDTSVNSLNLIKQFKNNSNIATKKYLNQIILVN